LGLRLTPLNTASRVRAWFGIPLAAAAAVAAFAFETPGGWREFLFTAAVFAALMVPTGLWGFHRITLEREDEWTPVPPGAQIESTQDVMRRELKGLALWLILTALFVAALGTLAAGMAVGSALPTPFWVWLTKRLQAKRRITIYTQPGRRFWDWSKPYWYFEPHGPTGPHPT
jgi:hypothetical protein